MKTVTAFGEMWARNSSNINEIPIKEKLGGRGVYVLYDGSMPVYIGKGDIKDRINKARQSKKRSQLWDHFSWYGLNVKVRHDIEALILGMLPPYLRSLTKQKGKFLTAERRYSVDEKADSITRRVARRK